MMMSMSTSLGKYRIRSKKASGKYITVQSDKIEPGLILHQLSPNLNLKQQFYLEQSIQADHRQQNQSPLDGLQHQNNPSHNHDANLKSTVHFIEVKTRKLLTLSQQSDQNGAPIVLKKANQISKSVSSPTTTVFQRFELHQSGENSSKSEIVIFTFCGKCLDCCEEATKNGTEIIQWEFHGSDNQKWFLEKV